MTEATASSSTVFGVLGVANHERYAVAYAHASLKAAPSVSLQCGNERCRSRKANDEPLELLNAFKMQREQLLDIQWAHLVGHLVGDGR